MEDSGAKRGRPRRDGLTVGGIARLAGVSAPTVSRVLNGKAGVAVDTRARVEEIIRLHGYRRPEATEPAAILELVFHELESLWALEIIRGVEQVARDNALAVVLTEMRGRLTPGKAWTEQVLERRPTGVIAVLSELTSAQQEQFASRGIPLVVLDPTGEPLHETPSIGATNWTGGLIAARHLIDLGHQRIALIAGPTRYPFCRARLDGYRAALDQAGLAPQVVESALDVPGGQRAATALLASSPRPTAICTANDTQALGVYEAARLAGIRIPDDLSVVGFDDLSFTQWSGPPMTTVRQPLVQMGSTAANLVLGLADGIVPENNRVELATSLVVRQSTAPPGS